MRHHDGKKIVYDHSIDHAIHIPEEDTANQNDADIRQKGDVSQRKMRFDRFDRHNDKVRTTGGGVWNIDDRISQPSEE